jgi:hypothetical protein
MKYYTDVEIMTLNLIFLMHNEVMSLCLSTMKE